MRNRLFVRRLLGSGSRSPDSFVLAAVADTTGIEGSYAVSDARLEVSDLENRVRLDFPLDTVAERRASLATAHTLADVLARFSEALEQEAAPRIGAEIFRSALGAARIAWTGEIRAEIDQASSS